MTRVFHIVCDRCGRDQLDTDVKAWSSLSYGYQCVGKKLDWELCPNCRLLLEDALVQLRILSYARDERQFKLEVSLAEMVDKMIPVTEPTE